MHAVEAIGAVIEQLLGLLGFRPVESLVVVAVQRGVVSCVMRLDIADALSVDTPGRLAELAGRSGADGAVAVFVSAESSSCPMCAGQFADVTRDLAAALQRNGVRLLDAVVVDRVEAGGRWHCLDHCGKAGVLNDPSTSMAAAAAVMAGRRMYGSREELSASVAVDTERAAALAPLLAREGAVDSVPVAVRAAVAAVRRVAEGAVLSDAELAGVGASLVDVRVRDALFTLVECAEAGAAEALWSHLARVLPQPYRVEALALTAFSSYARGAGPLAGVALDAARVADSTHRFTGMLDAALQGGLRPEDIRTLVAGQQSALSL